MKHLGILLLLLCIAANGQHSDWEKIHALESEGRIKSAMAKAERVYKRAVKRGDEPLQIKALLYKSRYEQHLDLTANAKILKNFEAGLQTLSPSSVAIFSLMYVKAIPLQHYSDRGFTRPRGSFELTTWSRDDYELKIDSLYNLALSSARLDKKPLANFRLLFNIADTTDFNSQTVYDYVLKQAIDYHTGKSSPMESDSLAGLLVPTDEFVKLDFSQPKWAANRKALELLKEAEAHWRVSAFIDRLVFVNKIGYSDHKKMLSILEAVKSDDEVRQKALALKLKLIREADSDNLPVQLALVDSIISLKKNTVAYFAAIKRRSVILRKELYVESDEFVYPHQQTKARINFRNIQEIRGRYFKIPFGYLNGNRLQVDSLLAQIVKRKPDYEVHVPIAEASLVGQSTEILLPRLPRGHYVAVFDDGSELANPAISLVTSTFLSGRKSAHDNGLYIYNRKSGKPMQGVRVETDGEVAQTDDNGYAIFSAREQRSHLVRAIFEGDTLSSSYYNFNYVPKVADTSSIATLLTDRGIYRPGQKVQFKGIIVQQSGLKRWVAPNVPVQVVLNDSNDGELAKIDLVTNEFGAVSGEFDLPPDTVTGEFSMAIEEPDQSDHEFWNDNFLRNNTKYFRVEAYKRPKYEIKFDAVKDDLLYGKMTTIGGKAVTFSGSPVSGASLSWAIRGEYKNGEVLKSGSGTTLDDGRFLINFIPTSQYGSDVSNFQLDVTITDASGQTESQNMRFSAGIKTLLLGIETPYQVDAKKHEVTLTSTNLNGLPKDVRGKVLLYRYNSGVNSGREVSLELIPDAVYKEYFPFAWHEKQPDLLIKTVEVDTRESNRLPANFFQDVPGGRYQLRFEADSTVVQKTIVVKGNVIAPDWTRLLHFGQLDSPRKPGCVSVRLASVAPELYVQIIGVAASGVPVIQESILVKGFVIIDIPTSEQDPLKSLTIESIYENMVYSGVFFPELPEFKKELKIEAKTMRNKLEPGTPEKWTFTVSGVGVSQAEVAATMFDYSLEKFAPLRWTFPRFKIPSTSVFRSAYFSFSEGASSMQFQNPNLTEKAVNSLNLFDFNFWSNPIRRYKPAKGKGVWGVVSDATGPIPRVYILVKGTSRSTQTDIDGQYHIHAVKGETLQFSFLGMKTHEHKIEKTGEQNVKLEESNKIGEVIVAGALSIQRDEDDMSGYTFKSMKARLGAMTSNAEPLIVIDGEVKSRRDLVNLTENEILSVETISPGQAKARFGENASAGALLVTTVRVPQMEIISRKILSETAFFYPHIQANDGQFSIEFTSPDALTTWKLKLLVHAKNAEVGYLEKIVQTQKDLMVVPNLPRFVRERDTVKIMVKVMSKVAKSARGHARLDLFDASTLKPIRVPAQAQTFILKNGQTVLNWIVPIPLGHEGLQYRVVAQSDDFSDGEEGVIPVLPNRILLKQSEPIWVNPKASVTVEIADFKSIPAKDRLRLVLLYNATPVWSVLDALPYLITYEHQCTEQTFARYFALVTGKTLCEKYPEVDQKLSEWKRLGAEVKNSPRDKNFQTKLATLLDTSAVNQMSAQMLNKLTEMQEPLGGFPWFKGGRVSDAITIHLAEGFAQLQTIAPNPPKVEGMMLKTIAYLDTQFLTQERENGLNNLWVDYMFARTYYGDVPSDKRDIWERFLSRLEAEWLSLPIQKRVKAALVLHRSGRKSAAKTIVRHFMEYSATDETHGMFWVENVSGYLWHQAPVETQVLLIELFRESGQDRAVAEMTRWLLRHRQMQHWPSTKATSAAIYSLITNVQTQQIASHEIRLPKPDAILDEALKQSPQTVNSDWTGGQISFEPKITIKNKSDIPGTGSLTLEYYQASDSVKSHRSKELNIKRTMYKKSSGSSLMPQVTNDTTLQVGDLIVIRLEISAAQPVDYVHIQDNRAACFEPVETLSAHHFTQFIRYYQTNGDNATQMFIDHFPAGTFVVEYEARVNNSGNFAGGHAQIQAMYAPEFMARTASSRIHVK